MIQSKSESKSSSRRWNWWLLATGVAIYFFVNFQRSSIPGSIFNELQFDFSASASQIANISAVFMYVYAITQLVAGLSVDKFGGVRTILGGGLLFCIGCLIFPVCGNLAALMCGRVLVGLGAGTIYLALVKEVDRIYPDKFTSVLGMIILLGYSGSIFGGLPLSKAVTVIHWRVVFAVVGVTVLSCYLGFVYCLRHVKNVPIRREKLSLKPFFIVLKNRNSCILLLAGGVGYAVYYLMLAVMGKKLLEDVCNTDPALAGGCLSLMVVVGGCMNYLMAYLSTRFNNLRKPFVIIPLCACVVGAVMGMIGLQLRAGTWYFVIVMLLFAASAGFSSVTNSLIREYNPPQYTGSGASILNFVAYLAVAFCGNIAGWLMELFSAGKEVRESAIIYPVSSYMAVFVLALLIALTAVTAGFMLTETRGENLYKKERLLRQWKRLAASQNS